MAERIRYKKVKDSLFESVQEFRHLTNGARYIVRLNTGQNFPYTNWFVLDSTTEIIAASGLEDKRFKAQIAARDALTKLGIILATERRTARREVQKTR